MFSSLANDLLLTLLFQAMSDALKIYLAICLLALLIKFTVTSFYLIKGDPHGLSHEKEHDLGNYIKILILILLGMLLLYLAKAGPQDMNNTLISFSR